MKKSQIDRINKRIDLCKTLDPHKTYTIKELLDIGFTKEYLYRACNIGLCGKMDKTPYDRNKRSVKGQYFIGHIYST